MQTPHLDNIDNISVRKRRPHKNSPTLQRRERTGDVHLKKLTDACAPDALTGSLTSVVQFIPDPSSQECLIF